MKVRLRAIVCALWFGFVPYRFYEPTPHYAPMSYTEHLLMNLAYAWRWATFGEDSDDWDFEQEVNGV